MKIICVRDYFGKKITNYLNDEFNKNSSFLYISQTNNIFQERKNNATLSDFFCNDNFFTVDTLKSYINKKIYASKNFLPNIDMYYILKKTTDYYFKGKKENKAIYSNLYYSIFELFKFLLFHNVEQTQEEIFNIIKGKYTEYCYHIFDLFNLFKSIIDELVFSIRNGETSHKIKELNITIKAKQQGAMPFDTIITQQKIEIKELLSTVDILYMDDFFTYHDLESYIVSCADELGKKITFITKDIHNAPNCDMIIKQLYSCHFKNDLVVEIIPLDDETPTLPNAISYLRENFYCYNNDIVDEKRDLFEDGSINIIQPFLNRNDEITFVANSISEILKDSGEIDENNIKHIIENEILIVSAVDRNFFSNQFDDIFKQIGCFSYREDNKYEVLDKKIDLASFSKIYYRLSDFIEENVLFMDKTPLTYYEKKLFFEHKFKRIGLHTPKATLISSPILEYIFQLYSIVSNGITPKKFRALLFSNWYYHTRQSETKWDTYIGIFKQIEIYFDKQNTVQEWIEILENIIELQPEIENNPIYRLHPFNTIETTDLKFILGILSEINSLVKLLSRVKGNIKKHLEILRKKIMLTNDMMTIDEDDLTDAQVVIKKFYKAVEKMTLNSTIDDMDTMFFAQHLKNLFSGIENDEEIEVDAKSVFRLPIMNMLNLKKYKYVFFIGIEADKYPRKHDKQFPFTKEIVDVLGLLNVKSIELDLHRNNIAMERYFFKNVIDFATERIYFTMTKYDGKYKNEFASYIEDIATIFDSDIKMILPNVIDTSIQKAELPTVQPIKLSQKDTYTVKELVTYKLCPKLYYHLYGEKVDSVAFISNYQLIKYADNVFYIALLTNFAKHNEINNKWYSAHNANMYYELKSLVEKTFDENAKYFSCLTAYELETISYNALKRAVYYISNNAIKSKSARYNAYTVRTIGTTLYDCNNYKIAVECDIAIYGAINGEKRISQNSIYLDFVKLKSTNRDTTIKKVYKNGRYSEYAGIEKDLVENKRFTDRLFLSHRLISKLNIQFDTPDYIKDGVAITNDWVNELLNTNFAVVKPQASKFCNYCIMNDVCKGNKETIREDV